MSPYLPDDCTQEMCDRAINGDPEREDPPKPLDVLDMMAEARRSLDQAEHAMYGDRYTHLAKAAAWARRARDYAHERWGAGQMDDAERPTGQPCSMCGTDPCESPSGRRAQARFEDDPGDAGDYVEMDEED